MWTRWLALLFIFLFARSFRTLATHVYGGELLYTYVSGNTYDLTLTLYGDCSAGGVFTSLYAARPLIYVYNNSSFIDSFRQVIDVRGLEVSPVCPGRLSSTTCNMGSLPGIKKFTYKHRLTLSGVSSGWRFVFTGSAGTTDAGRSNNITNIFIPGGTVMQIEARLNNTAGPNSSPAYSTIPTPFYCMGVEQQYNHGAIDADGDSLVFSLVPGIDARTRSQVFYASPFSATYPMAVIDDAFLFNRINGQITFIPAGVQDALIVCRVTEYRRGAIVGTSEREMTFVVLPDCEGTPPTINLANVSGGTVTGKNVINLCVGTPLVTFDLKFDNPSGDTSDITHRSVPDGADLHITNNLTANPAIHFSWNTDTLTTGIYTFFVTVKNNHCPISNTQTIAYTINITPVPTLKATQLSPTACVHPALMRYELNYGFLPRTLTLLQDGRVVRSYTDTNGIITDSLPAGNYTAIASSDKLCTVSIGIAIADSGQLPLDPFIQHLCIGAPEVPLFIPPAGDGATFIWYNEDHGIIPGPPTPSTDKEATYTWYVQQRYKVCTSATVPAQAQVHPPPEPAILNIPSSVCYGDSLFLEATGGIRYRWEPAGEVLTSRKGRLFIQAFVPVTITVHAEDQYGCTDSTSIDVTEIKQCCDFDYPNAFTPNDDGRNDTWRVITYGNMMHFRMTIFNRWGQIVYDSADPSRRWDGKQYGVPCDIGTYFYHMTAECLTGQRREYTGDITLIR